jgi:hypothetical protein
MPADSTLKFTLALLMLILYCATVFTTAAVQVENALEGLPTLGDLTVTRTLAFTNFGAKLSVVNNNAVATCSSGAGTCDYLKPCDMVELNSVLYTIQDTVPAAELVSAANPVVSVVLGTAANCNVQQVYTGVTAAALDAYTWASSEWSVTFTTPVGDRGKIGIDKAFLYNSMYNAASDVDLDVADGDNEVYPAGVPGESRLKCPGCAPGETPVGYRAVNLLADQFSYEGRQLTCVHNIIAPQQNKYFVNSD